MCNKVNEYEIIERIISSHTRLPEDKEHTQIKIRKTTHSISPYLYNALQIQHQILVQIPSNSYAAELQKIYKFYFKVKLGLVRFRYV